MLIVSRFVIRIVDSTVQIDDDIGLLTERPVLLKESLDSAWNRFECDWLI